MSHTLYRRPSVPQALRSVPKPRCRVLTFGVFDLLHSGHRWFLRTAKCLGNELHVIVARDRNAYQQKQHLPVQRERVRQNAVQRLPYVTHAWLGAADLTHRYDRIRTLQPNVIALGYDQHYLTHTLARDLKHLGLTTKIVRLKAYRSELYKSSIIKNSK